MADNTIDKILEKVPYSDGSFRRRMVAGGIVVIGCWGQNVGVTNSTNHLIKRRGFMPKIRFMLCLICMSLVAGCATNWPRQLDKKLNMLDKKGLVLATVSYNNWLDRTDYILPELFLITKSGDDDPQKYRFTGMQHIRALNQGRSPYLIVLDVKKNDYLFYSVRGKILGDFFQILFEAPILLEFNANDKEILYIGNIHLILRKKKSKSELTAGPVMPLLGQAAIQDATIDVYINDRYDRDLMYFEQVFPNIKGHNVVKRILPPWKRPSSKEFDVKDSPFFFF